MGPYERHFFVCVNRRPEGGRPSCGMRGAARVMAVLERGLADHPELWGRVQITQTSCLGPCFEGPTIVVYPEGVWYAEVSDADVDVIVSEHMVRGVPVERLRRSHDIGHDAD